MGGTFPALGVLGTKSQFFPLCTFQALLEAVVLINSGFSVSSGLVVSSASQSGNAALRKCPVDYQS